jgi:hypothetical protein
MRGEELMDAVLRTKPRWPRLTFAFGLVAWPRLEADYTRIELRSLRSEVATLQGLIARVEKLEAQRSAIPRVKIRKESVHFDSGPGVPNLLRATFGAPVTFDLNSDEARRIGYSGRLSNDFGKGIVFCFMEADDPIPDPWFHCFLFARAEPKGEKRVQFHLQGNALKPPSSIKFRVVVGHME